jgi:two-component system response regulator WspF
MRIAIVNDLGMAVEAVRRVLLNGHQHQLAWVAHDGAQAVEFCARDTPDLILMDLIMPRMDGVEATRRIMAHNPCPIVVVTASVMENSAKVFEAMGAGALDAVNTPVLESPGAAKGASALLTKIESVRKIVGLGEPRKVVSPPDRLPSPPSRRQSLVAIGASAGGPAALARILTALPGDFPAPIVIVQHVDPQFAQGLATWLDYQTPLHVRLAQEGDQPKPGLVLLAGREEHLVLANARRLTYTPQPVDRPHRPSIDTFFKSVDRFWPGPVIGVLLTGMGRDGAEGLRLLHQHRHLTIAQDERSSAVYGMPKAAVELHAVTDILPIDKIGPRLRNIIAQSAKDHV